MTTLPRKASLPPQWVDELALATSTVSSAPQTSTPPQTSQFDRKLDGFLDRFQREIVGAKQLKDDLDSDQGDNSQKKILFKSKMEAVRQLFATEGEDFVQSIGRRNPKLNMVPCGDNTIQLAQGIQRLESAVKEHVEDRHVKEIPPAAGISKAVPNINSDETLQLMQSDIQALKLELMMMRLQRTDGSPRDAAAAACEEASNAGNAGHAGHPSHPGHPYSLSVSPETKGGFNNNVSVVRVTGRANNFAPKYISHFEQMKSRLEALEKKPLTRRAKSAARLGRTQTMGSMYDQENGNPNIAMLGTPPRIRRVKHRSISTQSPADKSCITPETVRFRAISTPGSTPSPRREGGAGARLVFDGPEEMLQRPQSHAAARDIQRYSLKVARRMGPGERGVHESRARSAVASPARRETGGVVAGGVGVVHAVGGVAHAVSDIGTVAAPSTMDTTGSGGRVVEEIEGDMWVRKGVVWKRWRRRYASIVSHQFFGKVMCLFSYDSQGGVISTRSQIVVLNGSLCRALREVAEIGGRGRFVFVLRTSSKEYYFAAESDEIRRNWIRELRDAARVGKGRSMAFRKR